MIIFLFCELCLEEVWDFIYERMDCYWRFGEVYDCGVWVVCCNSGDEFVLISG